MSDHRVHFNPPVKPLPEDTKTLFNPMPARLTDVLSANEPTLLPLLEPICRVRPEDTGDS